MDIPRGSEKRAFVPAPSATPLFSQRPARVETVPTTIDCSASKFDNAIDLMQ
jgi:hypothetical protein